MAKTIIGETKRGGPKKAKGRTTCRNQKKGRELVPLMAQSYFIHNIFNVTYMQIMRFNSMGGPKQTSPTNVIFLSIVKAKTRWKTILTCWLKN
jgi:hypothetical protein